MRRLLFIALIIILGGYAAVAFLRGPARPFTAALLGAQQNEETKGPSFDADQDRDGLSDAKERIYGTDPQRDDTDGDGYADGEEVRRGFDPTATGSAKIAENANLMANLTVQYFEWARTVAKAEDPQLNDEAVQQFLNAEGLTRIPVPDVAENEIVSADQNGPEALRQYFTALTGVRMPDTTASYLDLADEVVRTQKSDILDNVLGGLVETYEAVRKIPVPQEARAVHREQLAFLKALRNLFSDLYAIDRDPVMLMRDIAWGNDLLQRSADLEQKRQTLLQTIANE
ncbi:MAG: hypothetical protein A2991_01430 [Candidatus Terrybacteria bacterium RIFCSPLOWO2_01_FULL_58_14]|uniref:Uncharacterized protein n=2 Tax=Candidatus Terryibacteriota TaxID=1817920 RepID=A0A1G2PXZ5_9BACT|nr:MAG: hypothetical protein A2682_01485 [Candidatus Terrybacteria bacterium RIFCSPHIGHO2_01_FULL_58_15]OHA53194.1 MAG: hypothetical protein A2991_01430 [Candidatus Terrybacteria bacterium RIFCSPLOWO2_01_FULL_58_14]